MAVRDPVAGSLATHQIPVLELTRAAGERLFALAGYATWEIERLPDVLPLPITATVRVPLAVSPTRAVSNVLGVIRGVDPDLSHEVVIVGAHLDHVGQLPDGTIYPGANKDASGVGLMLEIARLWQEEGFKPARTVLFAAWNASEKGLRGSQRYVASPTFPLSTTRAMIQLDEIGQGKGYYISVSGDETADARVIAHLENAAGRVEGRLTFDAYVPDSDHHTFHALGVPAVRLQWQEPEHTNQPTDSPETLDVTKMQAAGRVVALTLMTLSSP
jgi:Zn-dependent M28 family amino/carboxypeptidase